MKKALAILTLVLGAPTISLAEEQYPEKFVVRSMVQLVCFSR